MTMQNYAMALLVALLLAIGQLLFKLVAASSHTAEQSLMAMMLTWKFVLALFIYGAATLLWVYVLRTAEISRAYPIALAGSALIPLGAFFLFGERIGFRYIAGFSLLIVGLLIIATDSNALGDAAENDPSKIEK
tara:strand:+ start:92 stop:493 length:402 start_codon:yes stop_codon:yes gene_type:complete